MAACSLLIRVAYSSSFGSTRRFKSSTLLTTAPPLDHALKAGFNFTAKPTAQGADLYRTSYRAGSDMSVERCGMNAAEQRTDCSAIEEFKIRRHKRLHSFG